MKVFAYFLLLGFVLQTCSKQLIYTDYLVNKEFISEVFCINKKSPEKHCEGKCHLKKLLDQDTKQQDGSNQKSKIAAELAFVTPATVVIEITAISISPAWYFFPEGIPGSYSNSIFQPPCAA